MKKRLFAAIVLLLTANAFAAPPPKTIVVNGPTITSLPNFPLGQLRFNLSPKLYKSLAISPVSAWVVVQTPGLGGGDPKVIRSDAGGIYDNLALTLAKQWGTYNFNTVESRTHRPSLNVHLLIYKLPDGLMAVNFSHNDEAFYAGHQRTDVWIGVWKAGKWTTIGGTKHTRELPEPYR